MMKHIPFLEVIQHNPAVNHCVPIARSGTHANVGFSPLSSPKALDGSVLFSPRGDDNATFLPSFAPRPLRRFNATMKALTPASPVEAPASCQAGITDSCTVSWTSFRLQPPEYVRTSRCCSQWRA